MEKLQTLPPMRWFVIHPRLSAWVILSAGMIALLVYEARDVGLKTGNWIALIVATILVAGACILIVSWEDEDEEAEPPAAAASAQSTQEAAQTPPSEPEAPATEEG